MISLKQLRYFSAIARFGHFGQAADHCAITQPALSMQIQQLERQLGLELIERRPKGIRLTEAGVEIAERANKILSDVRDLGDYARHRESPLTGPLRLGVIPTLAPYVLPPLLPLMRRRYPDLDLHIRETQTETLVQELNDGTLDVLLLALPVDHAGFETLALFEDPFLLVLPADREDTKPGRADPDLLKSDRLLLLEEGHCLRDQALSFCQYRQVGHIDTFGASSLSTIVQMVANGMGLTLLPEISIGIEARSDQVRLMRFADPEPSRTIGLAWRSTSPRTSDFTAFGELIGEVAPINSDLLSTP